VTFEVVLPLAIDASAPRLLGSPGVQIAGVPPLLLPELPPLLLELPCPPLLDDDPPLLLLELPVPPEPPLLLPAPLELAGDPPLLPELDPELEPAPGPLAGALGEAVVPSLPHAAVPRLAADASARQAPKPSPAPVNEARCERFSMVRPSSGLEVAAGRNWPRAARERELTRASGKE